MEGKVGAIHAFLTAKNVHADVSDKLAQLIVRTLEKQPGQQAVPKVGFPICMVDSHFSDFRPLSYFRRFNHVR